MITRLAKSSLAQDLPRYRSMLAGNDAYIPTAFESIASTSGTGSSGTITFSSIPGTYQHLQLRFLGFSSTAGWTVSMTVNGAGGTSYARHLLYGNGSSAAASGTASTSNITVSQEVVGTESANGTAGIIDIHDYASTTRNKTIRIFSGMDKNGNGEVDLMSGVYLSTTAITSISLTISGNWTTNSTFALYGILGA